MAPRTLLIDNYDSYTFNLYQLIAEVNGGPPTVVCNDCKDQDKLLQQLQDGHYDSVVISPGPGTPHNATDIGLCAAVLEAAVDVPVLGVCLGMQALAFVHGARVRHAPEAVHGRLSDVQHTGHPLFRDIPSGVGSGFEVVRYHSLAVEEASLPACLHPIAWTCGDHHAMERADHSAAQPSSGAGAGETPPGGSAEAAKAQVLMAVAHAERPHYGVQFHPESIATKFGAALLHNFRLLADAHHGRHTLPAPAFSPGPPGCSHSERPWVGTKPDAPLEVSWRLLPGQLSGTGGSQQLFCSLYGSHAAQDTFWLDSSDSDRGRFSFMGAAGGPLWQRITYWLPPPDLLPHSTSSPASEAAGGRLVIEDSSRSGAVSSTTGARFFEWLEGQLRSRRCRRPAETAAALPFDFWGGFVGYLGYELKAECGGANCHAASTPDAAFFLADRIVVADHKRDDVYLLALHAADDAEAAAGAGAWIDATVTAITAAQQAGSEQHSHSQPPETCNGHAAGSQSATADLDTSSVGKSLLEPGKPGVNGLGSQSSALRQMAPLFELRHAREQYIQNVESCLKALHDGESYELCLTTALECQQPLDAFELYLNLRRLNPAPYAAWLSFGGGPQICCSSPERFLGCGRGGLLEARPIKGTASRVHGDPAADAAAAAALVASEKDRAENLMIVDLLRNDLGRVCEVGSVHVAGLMELESFATVHQLVSTVRGVRRQEASVVDCLRAAFPGGSMTGAPKLRSMGILDRLEGAPRGPYSGALGWIGFNDTFDLNIVIRTAEVHRGGVKIGAGGAIVVQSDPAAEFEEMELKAAALVKAVLLTLEKRV